MQPQEAVQALREIEGLQTQTRARLRDFWFPLAVFGALMLASAPLVATLGGEWLGPYWLVAGPLGGMIVSRYYRRRSLRIGLEGPYAGYVAVGIGIFVGCMVTGTLGGAFGIEALAVAGPPLVISAGLLAFGWLDRSAGEALVAVFLAVLTLGLVASDMDLQRVNVVVTFAYGTAWLIAGLVYRRLQH
jgi:hypothetical protein